MATYRSKGAVYAVIKESSFNSGGVFTDNDVVEVTVDTSLKPEVDSIERKASCPSFVAQPKVAGKEYGTGTFGIELIPDQNSGGIHGDVVLEVAMGVKETPGDGSGAIIGVSDASGTPANMIYEVQSGETGTATLYKLNKPCGYQTSLAIKQMLGCDTTDSQSLVFTGVLPNSVTFDFPVADIATVSFDVGASGFSTTSGETLLESICLTTNPYVGKNAIFTVDNVSYEAKDLQFVIENTVSDREAITSAGITEKAVTQKMVKGSLTISFAGWDELDKFKNNADAAIYLELASGSNKFAIYIPRARYTSVGIEDDDGILVNKIEFEASEDETTKEAIYIAHE